jgi:L-lactate dehydrogenase (cytochrome)
MQAIETLRSVLRFRAPELDPVRRRLVGAADVADLRRIARRRLPAGVFDYIDGGAEDERTLARNVRAFGRITFAPRVLRDVSTLDTSTTLFGNTLPFPLILAPTGFTRMVNPAGELDVARAAADAGLPYTLSTLSTRSIEEVAAVSKGTKWFQVYVWRDRGLVAEMLGRAADHGYEAITITVDTAQLGRRERDVRRGFTLPPKIGPRTILDGMLHPSWTSAFVRAEPIVFANIAGHGSISDGSNAVSLASYINSQFDPALSWSDLEWFRAQWKGPIALKGVQTVADARIAAELGVDAVILSNHGGRQLDDAPAPIDLVAPVRDVLDVRTAVICDGGVRRGSDIAKAVALGATACMAGRAYLYGLAAGGEAGVTHVLNHLLDGYQRTLALLGANSTADLNRELVAQAPPGQ